MKADGGVPRKRHIKMCSMAWPTITNEKRGDTANLHGQVQFCQCGTASAKNTLRVICKYKQITPAILSLIHTGRRGNMRRHEGHVGGTRGDRGEGGASYLSMGAVPGSTPAGPRPVHQVLRLTGGLAQGLLVPTGMDLGLAFEALPFPGLRLVIVPRARQQQAVTAWALARHSLHAWYRNLFWHLQTPSEDPHAVRVPLARIPRGYAVQRPLVVLEASTNVQVLRFSREGLHRKRSTVQYHTVPETQYGSSTPLPGGATLGTQDKDPDPFNAKFVCTRVGRKRAVKT